METSRMMPKRVDANQREIVNALRDQGLSVLVMSTLGKGAPDIAVGFKGKTYFFEIKDGAKPPSKQRLTPHEEIFFREWKGHIGILRSLNDALIFASNCHKGI